MTTPCPLCAHEREEVFRAVVLHKHSVAYFFCDSCGLLQTEEPHWLDEAYENAIADEDTGLVARNQGIARKLSGILYFCFDHQGQYVDSAGGYGMLTRLMRDIGFDFYWHDEYCDNLFAQGFEAQLSQTPYKAVTAFEVLEHVTNPLSYLEELLARYDCRTIIFSTELFSGPPPKPDSWWYYTLATGQHVSFYQHRTLELLARKLSMRLYSQRNMHILSHEPINRSAFGMMTGKLSWLSYAWTRIRMPSKTMLDHEKISGSKRIQG